jgi:D-aspartate ligase
MPNTLLSTPHATPAPQKITNAVAVVLGAGRNGLGAVRSLWKEKVRCIVVTDDASASAARSRCASRCVIASSNDDTALLDALEQINEPQQVLIPTADCYVDFVLRNRDRLAERFRFCIPDPEMAALLLDKAQEVHRVAAAGIPVPKTVTDLTIPGEEILRSVTPPLIVKPKTAMLDRHLGAKNVILSSDDQVRQFLIQRQDILPTLLAQELIPGDDEELWVCNCTFGPDHQLLGAFTFRRLGTLPPHFGSTTYAVSERNDDVFEQVKRLGAALGYVGPAMVEFKFDSRTGKYVYIELNPRIGMCNYFDTCCGVNNVYLTYALACGHEQFRV